MGDDPGFPPSNPFRLMNFVTQEQLEDAKKTRGERVDDGTAQRDRPLYEILKENKDKKDAEFNERFKHRPPKALDDDETEFLDKLEMSKREYEQQMAKVEAQELRSFQEAVAAHTSIVHEIKETSSATKIDDKKPVGKKNREGPFGGVIISIKPQAKKLKADTAISDEPVNTVKRPPLGKNKSRDTTNGSMACLVSYSDESEDDDS